MSAHYFRTFSSSVWWRPTLVVSLLFWFWSFRSWPFHLHEWSSALDVALLGLLAHVGSQVKLDRDTFDSDTAADRGFSPQGAFSCFFWSFELQIEYLYIDSIQTWRQKKKSQKSLHYNSLLVLLWSLFPSISRLKAVLLHWSFPTLPEGKYRNVR